MMRRAFSHTAAFGLILCLVASGRPRAGEAPARATTPTGAAAAATTESQSAEARAIRTLERLEKRHAGYRRVEGDFTQIRQDPVFLEDISSTGTFYFERPDRFRCDYIEPQENASSHLVIGDFVESYYPKIKQVERIRMQHKGLGIGETNYMLLAFGIDTDEIRKHFTVRDEPTTAVDRIRLVFVPKAPPEERPFAQFALELTERDMQPVRLEVKGDEGDYTIVKISKPKWNPIWQDDRGRELEKFRLQYPPDVEIISEL